MLLVTCKGCGKNAFARNHQDPDAALTCGCCPEDHDHAAAANACPGGHEDAACPDGPSCVVLTPEGEECPGGHHGFDVPGCTVCRPVTITLMPGSVTLRPALPDSLVDAAVLEIAQSDPARLRALLAAAGQGA